MYLPRLVLRVSRMFCWAAVFGFLYLAAKNGAGFDAGMIVILMMVLGLLRTTELSEVAVSAALQTPKP